MLQQVESVVFVDKILAECQQRRLKVLSKHDSIICRQSDKRLVTGIICRIMNQVFGKATYSLDVDGEVFKIPKRLVHTLFGLTYQANAPPGSPKATVSEYRGVSSENLTDASVWQSRSDSVVTSSPLPPIRQAQGRLSRGIEGTTLSDEKIKSERIRRLRDRLMGRE